MIPDIWGKVYDGVLDSRVSELIDLLTKDIHVNGPKEFFPVADSNITNDLSTTLTGINSLIVDSSRAFDVRAIYLEMNGFDINYDRWYFDSFAYEAYVNDPEDLEWLCEWQSENWPETNITGMEEAQLVFRWYQESSTWETNPEFSDTYETAMLLVMLKFMEFIEKVVRNEKLTKPIPVLCTAHEFESTYKIAP